VQFLLVGGAGRAAVERGALAAQAPRSRLSSAFSQLGFLQALVEALDLRLLDFELFLVVGLLRD